jgi:hypothetical protein
MFSAPPGRAAEVSAQGPRLCPNTHELAFRVERSIAMPLREAAPLQFRVIFEPEPATGRAERYLARLETRGASLGTAPSAERVFHASDCGRLGDLVSVAIALAIGSSTPPSEVAHALPLASAGSSSDSNDTAGTTAALAPEEPTARMAPSSRDAGPEPVLSLWLVGDSGSLPAPGAGVGLGFELLAGRWALRAGGTSLFDQHVALQAEGDPGADLSLAFAHVSACAAPLGSFRAPLALSACAGWELGSLSAAGTGVRTPRRERQLWSAPRVDAGVSWLAPATPLGLSVRLTALAPVTRDDFYLRDLGRVHRPPAVVGRLAFGVDVHF